MYCGIINSVTKLHLVGYYYWDTIGYWIRDLPNFSAVPQLKTCKMILPVSYVILLNPLNAELNPICHLLALLGTHLIFHVSRITVNYTYIHLSWVIMICYLWFDPQMILLSYCRYTGLDVREIKRFVGYRQYKTKDRQKRPIFEKNWPLLYGWANEENWVTGVKTTLKFSK